MRKRRIPCTLIAALFVGGCTVGPDYRRPKVQVPAGWVSPTAAAPVASTQPSVAVVQAPVDIAQWWRTFNDPELQSLIVRALESNLDLRTATLRVREARASRSVAASALYPNLNASGAYRRAGSFAHNTKDHDLYQAGLDSSWEVDIFGGVRRGVEAAEADVAAAVEDRRDVQVVVASEVALSYLDVRSLQRQVEITHENLVTQRRSLDLTRLRFRAGFETGLDTANAESSVANTEAQLPLQEANLRQSIYALGVLLGREPGALTEELSATAPVPRTPQEVPVGLPSDLLRRRPDIRRAEAQLHAATARVGVAVADLYPRFSLTGSLTVAGDNVQSLTNRNFAAWGIGPSVNWPLFQGGRIRANIAIREAFQEEALVTYRSTILSALREVENALINYVAEQQHRRSLIQAVQAERRALQLSTELYRQGETDFLNVLVAQRQLYSSEDALVQSDRNVAQNLVSLYTALGGGWEDGDLMGSDPGVPVPSVAPPTAPTEPTTRPSTLPAP